MAAYKRYYETQSSEIEEHNQKAKKEKEAAKDTLINKLKSKFD